MLVLPMVTPAAPGLPRNEAPADAGKDDFAREAALRWTTPDFTALSIAEV